MTRPKKSLKVFWEFRPASVTWVESDENPNRWLQLDLLIEKNKPAAINIHKKPFKIKWKITKSAAYNWFWLFSQGPLFLVAYGILYGLDLHSYHGQHLHRDPVKLIEASPHTCLSQALVDVTYRLQTKDG